MKLREITTAGSLIEMREFIAENLYESIDQYLAITLGKLKNKKADELFKDGDANAIDLDHLAAIVVGVKVLGDKNYRSAFSKDDLGIQVNDPKDLVKLFNDVSRDGKSDPSYVKKVFSTISKLAPTALATQQKEFELLKTGTDPERQHIISNLERFLHKFTQAFGKLKQSAQGSQGKPNIKTVGVDTNV